RLCPQATGAVAAAAQVPVPAPVGHALGVGVPVGGPLGGAFGDLVVDDVQDRTAIAPEGLPGVGLLNDADLVGEQPVGVVALAPVAGVADRFDDPQADRPGDGPDAGVLQRLADALDHAEVREVALV